jgi:dTDP-4-amino-4,6-dideoxygalactose transaminase
MIPLFKVRMSPDAWGEVKKVLDSGYIGQGPKVDRFEKQLKAKFGTNVLTVNSCTSGLDLAYHMIGLKPGDEVISTPLTCTATNSPLINRGVKIKWADVDINTGNIDPNSVESLINDKTKAIVIVDWCGRECSDRFKYISKQYDIPIVEDAAHVYHVKPGGYPKHNWYTVFSYQAIKHLTTGDGGAMIVPPDQYERAKLLRWYGLDRTKGESFRCSQNIKEVGYKYQLNDIAAAIGLCNFYEAEMSVKLARINAEYYDNKLGGMLKFVRRAPYDPGSSWWLYDIRTPNRDEFIKFFTEKGIMAGQVHARNDKHDGFPKSDKPLPNLSVYDSTHCAIPVGWWLVPGDRDYIIDKLIEWDQKLGSDVHDLY